MGMRMRLAAVAAVLALPMAGAEAAPQMLGGVASAEPKPPHCANGTCTVEFSAFCLQQERDMPAWGTVHAALDPGKITFVAALPDGTVVPGDHVNMRRCLEFGHDGFMSEINHRYWTLIGAGV